MKVNAARFLAAAVFAAVTVTAVAQQGREAGSGENAIRAGHGEDAAAGAELMAIDVLLEPDEVMASAARAANERLRRSCPAGFALDASHVPHVTVMQRYVRQAELKQVIGVVADVVSHSAVTDCTMTATGFYAAPFAGVSMANVRVAASTDLGKLQDALAAALKPFAAGGGTADAFVPEADGRAVNQATVDYVRDYVPASSGANYIPHVTVGIADPQAVARLLAEPFPPFRFRAMSVSVYQLGNFGTARRLLWRSPGTDHP